MTERKKGPDTFAQNPGNRGKGRPKGSKNKMTVAAKESVALAAEGLGGTDRLIAWAKEDPDNERVFWQSIYTKLIPLEHAGEVGVSIMRKTVYEAPPD